MVLSQNRLILWGGQPSNFDGGFRDGDLKNGAIFDLATQDWNLLPEARTSGIFNTLSDLGESVYVSGSYEGGPQLLELPDAN